MENSYPKAGWEKVLEVYESQVPLNPSIKRKFLSLVGVKWFNRLLCLDGSEMDEKSLAKKLEGQHPTLILNENDAIKCARGIIHSEKLKKVKISGPKDPVKHSYTYTQGRYQHEAPLKFFYTWEHSH